ncbi:MAG: hypothetical protein K2H91_00645 [Lachnospiraceae bacterium]|nr:hypothetical protein [Lachnospiraceae bacterium]
MPNWCGNGAVIFTKKSSTQKMYLETIIDFIVAFVYDKGKMEQMLEAIERMFYKEKYKSRNDEVTDIWVR